ncbi:HpcH/HpaI aldolase family protein [Pseudonocardia sp. RS010]|uniref:HpcH/HpaI aldolase family protein n=1 Tax=Pseudonocardia sp. RS010 TaxID=3385979 RepID=UPI00399F75EC
MPRQIENRARRKLAAGEPVLAPILGPNSLPDADHIERLGMLGLLDIAWIEMEHGPITWSQLGDLSRVCDLVGITSMVRVNQNVPSIIGRTLDQGVQGIMVPHVDTAEEARRIVEGARYAPLGERGVGTVRRSFGVENYYRDANDDILVVAMIEDVRAIANLDEILAVDHIDCFFVAPSDLAQTMGEEYLWQPQHPEVQELVLNTIRRVVAAGRTAGTVVDEKNVGSAVAAGARLLRFTIEPFIHAGLRAMQEAATAAL